MLVCACIPCPDPAHLQCTQRVVLFPVLSVCLPPCATRQVRVLTASMRLAAFRTPALSIPWAVMRAPAGGSRDWLVPGLHDAGAPRASRRQSPVPPQLLAQAHAPCVRASLCRRASNMTIDMHATLLGYWEAASAVGALDSYAAAAACCFSCGRCDQHTKCYMHVLPATPLSSPSCWVALIAGRALLRAPGASPVSCDYPKPH